MKNRGMFFMAMLLTLAVTTGLFATDYKDFGLAGELVVIDYVLSDIQTNSSSTVSTITQEGIESAKPDSTASLVNLAMGTGFSSYGALGAQQSVQIRGSNANQVDIYLDGLKLNSAHEGMFDLSLIPVPIIKQVSVTRSGAASNLSTAMGGTVEIETKKGIEQDKPFTLTLENGSFLPLPYTNDQGNQEIHWIGLVDTQKGQLSYSNAFGKLGITATAGGQYARNNYTYDNAGERKLRKNAGMWDAHGQIGLTYSFNPQSELSVANYTIYKHMELPGSLTFPSLTDNQNDWLTVSSISYVHDQLDDGFIDLAVKGGYIFNKTSYNGAWSSSTHDKHNAQLSLQTQLNISDMFNVIIVPAFTWDYVDSTDIGKRNRFNPNLGLQANVYFLDGALSLHPTANFGWTNDFGFAPTATLGLIGTPFEGFTIGTNASYTKRDPSFSDLYWPDDGYSKGNVNLEPETALSGEVLIGYTNSWITYQGTAFVKDMKDQIAWQPVSGSSYWIPTNYSHTLYTGTEQQLAITPIKGLSLGVSYLLNYSWDLCGGNTFSSNVRVANTRMHTIKFTAAYAWSFGSVQLDGQYLGKSTYQEAVFLMDATLNFTFAKHYNVYLAVENLLNTSYQLYNGYPMPGTKLRIGASASF